MVLQRRRGDGGAGDAVGFALVAFGLVVALGVWVVLDGDEGGLVHGVFEAVVSCSVVGGGARGCGRSGGWRGLGRRRRLVWLRWGSGGGFLFR